VQIAVFLLTVQIGITLVSILSGALSGATLGLRLAEWTLEVQAHVRGFLFAITDKS
jgi:CBS domain containing-hemolysin-like protein